MVRKTQRGVGANGRDDPEACGGGRVRGAVVPAATGRRPLSAGSLWPHPEAPPPEPRLPLPPRPRPLSPRSLSSPRGPAPCAGSRTDSRCGLRGRWVREVASGRASLVGTLAAPRVGGTRLNGRSRSCRSRSRSRRSGPGGAGEPCVHRRLHLFGGRAVGVSEPLCRDEKGTV